MRYEFLLKGNTGGYAVYQRCLRILFAQPWPGMSLKQHGSRRASDRAAVALVLAGDEGDLQMCFIRRARSRRRRSVVGPDGLLGWGSRLGLKRAWDGRAGNLSKRSELPVLGDSDWIGTLSELPVRRGVSKPTWCFRRSSTTSDRSSRPLELSDEVAEAYWIPLAHLWDPRNADEVRIVWGQSRDIPRDPFPWPTYLGALAARPVAVRPGAGAARYLGEPGSCFVMVSSRFRMTLAHGRPAASLRSNLRLSHAQQLQRRVRILVVDGQLTFGDVAQHLPPFGARFARRRQAECEVDPRRRVAARFGQCAAPRLSTPRRKWGRSAAPALAVAYWFARGAPCTSRDPAHRTC